jgi:protein-S-isoprenylcysteine O-methyltransferase Ste14
MILSYGVLALSVACFGSFSWAIVKLFNASTHASSRMKLLGIVGVTFSIAQIAVISLARPVDWRTLSALVLYIVALGLFWWAVPQATKAQLNIAFTNAMPVVLLVDGPYEYVRHPFYASYLLYWVAGALISNWLWVSVFVMGCFYFAAIREEEDGFRLSPLAASYDAYRRKTGALFPVVGVAKQK